MKRKQLLTKTLLIAAMLCLGMSVWADVPTYTWDFTNKTTWTTAKVSTGSAVTLNPSGETPGAGEYGVTFNLTNETGGFVGWKYYANNVGSECFWYNENGNATTNTVSITVPAGFKVTFNLVVGSNTRPFVCTKDGGTTTSNITTTPYEYTNDTEGSVTVTMWATNCINGVRRMNGITSIVLQDFSAVASHTWSAKAYATINDEVTEIDSWDADGAEYNESETYNVWAKKVIKYDGHYYELDDAKFATNAVYFSTKMGDADAEHEITYTLNDNIAYYKEGEDLGAASQDRTSLVASAGAYTYYVSGSKEATIADAGVYRMETNVLDRGSNSSLFVYENDGSTVINNELDKPGNGFKKTSNFPIPNANTTIKIGVASGNNSLSFDYVIIRKAPVAYTVEYKCGSTTIKTADATRTATWGTNVALTDADKEDIKYEGHLYRYTTDDASTQTIAADGTTVITVNFEDLGAEATITYTLNVGTSADTTIKSSTSTTDGTNITGIDIDQTNAGANGTGASDRTAKLDIKTGANGETFDSPTNYVLFKYSVASGKKFTPTNIAIKVANVGSSSANDIKYKATLSDGVKEISGTYVVTTQDGTVEDFIISNEGNVGFTGDVTLKLWAWQIGTSNAFAFRMGTPLTITGLVNDLSAVELAIIDCKTYETSSDFKTYIEAKYTNGDFSTAVDVYAAHTAWQVENGTASKAILNNTVTSADHYSGDAGTLLEGADYADAPDTYYLSRENSPYNVNQIVYQLPAGTYKVSAWTYASSAGYRKLYVSKVVGNNWTDLVAPESSDQGWKELSDEFTLTEKANVAFGFYGAAIANGSTGFDNWTLEMSSVPVTISSVGWATYCSPYILDFSETGATVYTAALNTTTNNISLSEVSGGKVPANTGVILYKNGGGDINPAVIASANPIGNNNELVGIVKNTTVTYNPSEGIYNYIMEWDDVSNKPMFSKAAANGATLTANKAYLSTDYNVENSLARALAVASDAIETTGINNVQNSGIKAQGYYNLNGQRVSNPTKGLYIVNGRKVVVK